MADIWSLGVTFYQILTGSTPFDNANNVFDLYNKIINEDINFELIKNKYAREVIRKMLERDPE